MCIQDIKSFSKDIFPNLNLTYIKNVIDKPIHPKNLLYYIIVDNNENIVEFYSEHNKNHIVPCFNEMYVALEFARYKNILNANLCVLKTTTFFHNVLYKKNNRYVLLVIDNPEDSFGNEIGFI